MNSVDYIVETINRLPKGYVFTYADFVAEVNRKEAIIKALNRLAVSGKISKLSKGKFYKPENSTFGMLPPNQSQIVKDLLERNGKLIGYLTGYSIYNQLGLTTQVSNSIQIGKIEVRPTFKRGNYTISFVRQKNTITKDNIPLLQILDAIRYIKKIPDCNPQGVCKRLFVIIKALKEKDKNTLIRLALKYPPATRALLGALLDTIGKKVLTELLYKSLNHISIYKLEGVNKILPTAVKWHIT
ncbi:MAG: hypothetical protein IPP15_16945 [Saprospiraceae bacterium]|uniref:AbiEi antitoxin C-terminal domain-containing protein n=1 Tax=Candidatus Opimibacter skivensis TaxID=2982028 RepID=A0A9D7XTS0_9BACT|nr:hypothetical protein [Candidatus Opimibacter skivensis]